MPFIHCYSLICDLNPISQDRIVKNECLNPSQIGWISSTLCIHIYFSNLIDWHVFHLVKLQMILHSTFNHSMQYRFYDDSILIKVWILSSKIYSEPFRPSLDTQHSKTHPWGARMKNIAWSGWKSMNTQSMMILVRWKVHLKRREELVLRKAKFQWKSKDQTDARRILPWF